MQTYKPDPDTKSITFQTMIDRIIEFDTMPDIPSPIPNDTICSDCIGGPQCIRCDTLLHNRYKNKNSYLPPLKHRV